MLELIFVAALTVAGVIFALNKWGILDYYGVYIRRAWLPPHDCYFCLSAWISFVPILVYFEMVVGERFDFSLTPTRSDFFVLGLSVISTIAAATLSAFFLSILIQPKEV